MADISRSKSGNWALYTVLGLFPLAVLMMFIQREVKDARASRQPNCALMIDSKA